MINKTNLTKKQQTIAITAVENFLTTNSTQNAVDVLDFIQDASVAYNLKALEEQKESVDAEDLSSQSEFLKNGNKVLDSIICLIKDINSLNNKNK